MAALPKPALPAGPQSELFDALHELHHHAGWPSLREMAKEVGCSHTTVSAAFAGPRLPRWGLLELIVEALGGEVVDFHRRWLAASLVERAPEPREPMTSTASVQVLAPAPRSIVTPHELPADVAGFTGRRAELQLLDELLDAADGTAPAIVIAVVSGTAGVGKTALALHWAHRMDHRFPDGELYVDLRGYDPGRPVTPAEALEAFLRTLGVRGSDIPAEQADRAARYRTLVAGRRMLVVLDNARSVEQVRDLMPGTRSCFVVVTSRNALPALVARYGARRIDLSLLPPEEAHQLLRMTIGSRVDADGRSAGELARRCARLPLALRICAELAASRPTLQLRDLVSELADPPRRLDLLAAGEDDHTAVRAVFSWSMGQLREDTMRAFCLLGLQPGADFDGYAAAALTGTDLAASYRLLVALARAHLIEEVGDGRFAMHDLLRDYAAERAATEFTEQQRVGSLRRLLDYYLRTAAAATAAGLPGGLPADAGAVSSPPSIATPPGAIEWLDTEWRNLLDSSAVEVDGHDYAVRFATTLACYIESRDRFSDGLALYDHALQVALETGDLGGQATVLDLLGTAYRHFGRYPDALEAHDQALKIHHQTGNVAGQAKALRGIGAVRWRCGQYGAALEALQDSLRICRETGDVAGEGVALNSLGIVYRRLGRYPEAVAHYEQSRACQRAIGDRAREAGATNNLGIVHLRLGRPTEAQQLFQGALDICREVGNGVGAAAALTNLGEACERLGRYDEALVLASQALKISRDLGYRVGEGDALHGIGVACGRLGRHEEAVHHLREAAAIGAQLGEALVETGALIDLGDVLAQGGQTAQSREHCDRALVLARSAGDQYEQGRALAGIAGILAADGEHPDARTYREQALGLFAALGVPEAEVVRDQLSD